MIIPCNIYLYILGKLAFWGEAFLMVFFSSFFSISYFEFGRFLNLRYYKIWMPGKKLKAIEKKFVSVHSKRFK